MKGNEIESSMWFSRENFQVFILIENNLIQQAKYCCFCGICDIFDNIFLISRLFSFNRFLFLKDFLLDNQKITAV